ncbi:hypothetical protein AB0K43_16240 [Kitasatospora sp. NPDC049258]|uniref:hypothetical protein n=1 Tax=Kitasatospora sp. NPDC049258 TaxID=3155394 RepID=UPI0034219BB6
MRVRPILSLAVVTALALTAPALAAGVATAATLAAPAPAPAPAPKAAPNAGPTTPAAFVPIVPTRVLDTRNYDQVGWNVPVRPLAAGENYLVNLQRREGHMPPSFINVVPAGATAVVVNVTATDTTADGYLSVGPEALPDGTVPPTSTLNFKPGATVAAMATVAIKQGQVPSINVYNHEGRTDVVVDVLGYYLAGAPDKYAPVRPTRVLDTRDGAGTPMGGWATRTVDVAREDLHTADAKAVILNVTVTAPDANSFLTIWPHDALPHGAERPDASSINFEPGRTVANQVVVPVGPDGKINIFNRAGNAHVIVDVVGSYGPSGTGLFSAIEPVRLFDTRTGGGAGQLPFSVTERPVAGSFGVPADAVGAALNITATQATQAGHLTVYPGNQGRPNTSTLNFTPGLTVANSATVGLDHNPVDIYNHAGFTHVIGDLTGYFVRG